MAMSDTTPHPASFDGRYAKWTLAAVVFFVVLEAAYFTLSGLPSVQQPSLDFTGNAVGRDFLTTWMTGRSILGYGPAAWSDPAVHNAALRVMFGPNFPEHLWSHPPHFVLFTWPFGLLPYLGAYTVWCALGIGLYVLASMPFVRREHLLFVAAAPGVAVCVFFGQNGFYTAALMLGGIALVQRQQIAAGILFGILTVEPQLCILLPLVLVMTKRWGTLIAAAVTAAALMFAAAQIFGPHVWSDFIEKVIPQQRWLLEQGGGLLNAMVASTFFGARLVGLPLEIAWVLQGIVSLAAVAAVIWTFWRPRDPVLSVALFVAATFLATPYVLNYDMVIFSCIVAMLRQRNDNTPLDHWLGLAVWSLPATMMLLGAAWVPFGPLVLIVFGGRLLWRLAHKTLVREDTSAAAAGETTEPKHP